MHAQSTSVPEVRPGDMLKVDVATFNGAGLDIRSGLSYCRKRCQKIQVVSWLTMSKAK